MLVERAFRAVGFVAISHRALEEPCNFRRCAAVTLAFIIEWMLPLRIQAMRVPHSVSSCVCKVLAMLHYFLVRKISVKARTLVNALNSLMVCHNASSALVPVDDVLPFRQQLL